LEEKKTKTKLKIMSNRVLPTKQQQQQQYSAEINGYLV